MEEEKILIYNEENNYDTVVVEDTDEIIYDETIQIVEVDEPELFTVGADNAFAALGEQNEQLNHALLHNRDLPDQHPIQSITGLREELDGIHALKTVESDKRGSANYYEWRDAQNLLPGDRIGYFVSIHTRDHKISICNESTEIFGVTVDSAGFVGWQHYDEEDKPRDEKYALVANTGVVKVRCSNKVVAGNYVMSNNYGEAVVSDNGKYGYYVISIDVTDDQRYAVISLDSTMNQVYQLSEDVADIEESLVNIEIKTNAAINAATEALKNNFEFNINSALQNSQNALDNANSALDKVTNLGNNLSTDVELIKAQIDVIDESVVAASQKAALEAIDGLVDDAIDANQEIEELWNNVAMAQETAQTSLDETRALTKEMEPIISYSDGDYIGAAGIVASTEDNAVQLAAISQCLSNDYQSIDTWGNNYDKDTSQIYYVKDTELYYYYNAETDQWLSTSEPSEAGLLEVIASIRQKTDKNEAMVEDLTSYVGRDYEIIPEWNGHEVVDVWSQNTSDPYIIYYDKSTGLYWQCDLDNLDEPWTSSETAPRDDLEEKDVEQIYYAEDKELYYYYDNGWRTTDSPSIAGLVESIALTKQLANKNEARIDDIISYTGENGKTITEIREIATENQSEINLLTSYIQNNYTTLEEPWDEVGREEEVIYYAQDPNDNNTWKYWYYKDDIPTPAWVGSVNPSDARLTVSIANVQQQATENGASITALQAWQGDTKTAINELQSWVDENGAGTTSLIMNISKYTVGEYSQAHGLTVKKAQELLQDGSVFVPTKDVNESYDRLVKLDEDWSEDDKSRALIYGKNTNDVWQYWYYDEDNKVWTGTDSISTYRYRSFFQFSSYIWDKTNGVWVHGGDNVAWIIDYVRGDEYTEYVVIDETYNYSVVSINTRTDATDLENYTMYYAEDESQYYYYAEGEWLIAQDPNFEIGALYYWNTEEVNPYWQKVARIDGNTLNRAISQVSQSVSDAEASFNAQISTTNGNLAGMQAAVDAFGSTYVTKTTYDDKISSIEQKTDDNEARLSLLVAKGYETVDTWDENERAEDDKNTVFYVKDSKRYYYWDGESWSFDTDVDNVNIDRKINSAGIIASINDDTSEIQISGDKVNITAEAINLAGAVTFTNLKEENDKTVINGSNITTGTIDVNRLNVGRDVNVRYNLITAGDFCDPNGGSGWEKDASNPPDGITHEYSTTYPVDPVVGQNYMRILVGESEALDPNIINKYLVSVVGGTKYTASYYLLRQREEDTRLCHLAIDWLDSSGTKKLTSTIEATDYDTQWHRYSQVVTCPTEATQARIRFYVENNSDCIEGTTQKFNEFFIWICGVMLSEGETPYAWDDGIRSSNVIINLTGIDIYNGAFKIYDANDNAIFEVNDDGDGNMYIDGNIRASSMTIGEGSIGTTHIADGAITTDKIEAGAITVDKIDTGVLTADTIIAGDCSIKHNGTIVGGIYGGDFSSNPFYALLATKNTYGMHLGYINSDGVPYYSLTIANKSEGSTVSEVIVDGQLMTDTLVVNTGIVVSGGIDATGSITSGGSMTVNGTIIAEDVIRSKTNLWADGDIYAQGSKVASVASAKTNIAETESMLNKIRNAGIYSYNYISDIKSDLGDLSELGDIILNGEEMELEHTPKNYGLVIGEGYNTPSEVISADGKHVDLYSMISLAWKGIQELADIVDTLTDKITTLETKIEIQNTTEE